MIINAEAEKQNGVISFFRWFITETEENYGVFLRTFIF